MRLPSVLLAAALLLGGCVAQRDDASATGEATAPALAAPPAVAASPSAPSAPAPVSFTTPTGFTETQNYELAVPLHAKVSTTWLVPTGAANGNVIAVNSYVLERDVSKDGDGDILVRIDGYLRKVSGTGSDPQRMLAGPYSGWHQTIEQPGRAGTLRYDAVFVFSGWYLVQVICQHAGTREQIYAGCQTVLDSLKIQGV